MAEHHLHASQLLQVSLVGADGCWEELPATDLFGFVLSHSSQSWSSYKGKSVE